LKTATLAISLGVVTIMMTAQTNPNAKMVASPISGTAPLVVTFSGFGSGMPEGVMILDFGDGQTDSSISTIRTFTRTHTYTSAGSYNVELKSGAYGGQQASKLTTVSRVTITVR
jgi:PKD repeat protein